MSSISQSRSSMLWETVGLTLADAVTIVDLGANLGALSVGQIAALAGKNVDAIDATDNVLNLSVAQLNALGTVKLTAATRSPWRMRAQP